MNGRNMQSSYRSLVGVLLLAASCHPPVNESPATGPKADIAALASRSFLGRRTGTAGGDSAAAFLMHRFVDLHLRPAFRAGCDADLGCGKSYVQVFPFQKTVGQNVGAVIDGTDSTLRAEYFVIGAHFDGQSLEHVSDPEHGFLMRPGADDNASGTAGVLELARRFVKQPIRRSIVVLGFDAEEAGRCGSRAFVAAPPVAESTIARMLNLDMIGHLHGNRILVEGVAERATSRLSIKRAAVTVGLRPGFIADRELSDHVSFRDRGVDVVSLSTGDNPDYHTTNDVAAHVNMDGVNRVIDFAEAIIRDWDAQSPSKTDAPKARIRSSNPEHRPEFVSCGI
jgi:hypothetical protein